MIKKYKINKNNDNNNDIKEIKIIIKYIYIYNNKKI